MDDNKKLLDEELDLLKKYEDEIRTNGKEKGLSDEEIEKKVLSYYKKLQIRLKEKIDFENSLNKD